MEESEFEFTILYFKVYYFGSESHKQPIPYHTQIHCLYRDNIHSFISRTPWLPVHSWKDRTIIILPWQPICCRIQNHDLPLPLSRHSLLWVLYLRTIKTVRETVNHNCCHVCRRVKKKWIRIHFFVFQSILSKVNSSGYPADHRIPYQYPQPKPYVQPIPLVDDFKDLTDFRSQ